MSELKAIETSFKGYKFRSRLEARWAVFFDAMGMDWTYEPEGFHLPNGVMYLPDFFVKNDSGLCSYWYEIKPKNSDPCLKVTEFNKSLNMNAEQSAEQLNGDPFDAVKSVCPRCLNIYSDENYSRTDYGEHKIVKIGFYNVNAYNCYQCDYCDMLQGGFNDTYSGNFQWHKGTMIDFDFERSARFKLSIHLAKIEARQARFASGGKVDPFKFTPEILGRIID